LTNLVSYDSLKYKLRKEKVMKKLLIGVATVAMMMLPVAAKAGNDWIGPAIFGTVFGVIIANNHHDRHNNTTVVVEAPRREYRRGHHRHHRRHSRRLYEWVEVCKRYPHLRQNRWGDYYTVMRHECRVVKKAVW